MGRDVMLETVPGANGTFGRDEMFESAWGKGVGGEIRDVTDSARGKGPFRRDVLLQTVQGGKG